MVSTHRIEGNFHAGLSVHKEPCGQWKCVDDMRGLVSWAGSLQQKIGFHNRMVKCGRFAV
jgi:hypothetical protein